MSRGLRRAWALAAIAASATAAAAGCAQVFGIDSPNEVPGEGGAGDSSVPGDGNAPEAPVVEGSVDAGDALAETSSEHDAGDAADGPVALDSGDAPTDTATATDAADAADAPDTACLPSSPLYPSTGTVFCPFGPDASTLYCTSGVQQCCIGGTLSGSTFADSVCTPLGATCTNGTNPKPIECADPVDCPDAGLCCAQLNFQPPDSCGNLKANAPRSTCEATCAAGEVRICASPADCTASGTQCLPLRASVISLGYCAPSKFSVAPAVEPFGPVTVGTTSGAMTLFVTNDDTGTSPSVSVVIGNQTPVRWAITGTTCNKVLPAGGNCSVSVTFTPAAVGADHGTLVVVAAGAPVATALLTGTGQ